MQIICSHISDDVVQNLMFSFFLAVEFLNNVAAIRGESGRQVAQWMLAGDHHDDDVDDGYDHDADADDDADDTCTYLYNTVHYQRSHNET